RERMKRHIDLLLLAATAVDDGRRADDLSPGSSSHIDCLPRRFTRRHDVLDDKDFFARRQPEPAPQRQFAVLPLGEDRADAKSAPYFLSNDNPAQRRREDGLRAEGTKMVRERDPTRLSVTRMLQHESTLQVAWTVQSRG